MANPYGPLTGNNKQNKAPFDQEDVARWDLPRKLSYFMKVGIGRAPNLKPPRLDDPTSAKHKEILDAQFGKATNDYYMRLTEVDPDRLRSYEDFEAMEYTPEIASALDIYADECMTEDAWGKILNIETSNNRVKEELDRLFYDVLDIRNNLWGWIRAMCKYGNHYLLLDIDEEKGVLGHMSLPAKEMTREEAYDGNLNSVKFNWMQNNLDFDAWQIAHFRLLNDDKRYPYGTSMLESARRVWKQLTLAEDAMIVYRTTRAPERRIFKIDVGNIDPNDVHQYIEKIKRQMKRIPAVEHQTGKMSFKYNVMSVDEDFFVPVRGDRSSDIDTLQGASNLDEIADIEYLQQKLFASMKIPKAFLTYEEDVNAKATLAGQDNRFARTIQRIQGSVMTELQKIALIHLYTIGIRDRDQLGEFRVRLTNPNSALELENLELLQTRASVMRDLWEYESLSPVSLVWALRNIMNFTDAEIKLILHQQFIEGGLSEEFLTKFTPDFDKGTEIAAANATGGEPNAGVTRENKGFNPNLAENEFTRQIDRMIQMSYTAKSKSLNEEEKDDNPLVEANTINSEKVIKLMTEVDNLVKPDLSGVTRK